MKEELHNKVIQLYRGGCSIRQIASRLGISRYQVSRILEFHEQARAEGSNQLPQPKKTRASCLDEHLPAMHQMLERYPDITAVRMHEELRKWGFGGSYNTVKRKLRNLRGRKVPAPVQRFETGPGLQAQMDYSPYTINFSGEGRRRVHLFSYLLSYSRRQYLRFVESDDFTTTIREHVRAFEYLKGVATTCLYDNMKVAVTRYEGGEPIYNTRFLAFATHYGYRPIACRPRRSQTKGKVERPFHYVEVNLLNARTFHSLEHLNDATAHWLRNVADVRLHRETKQRPIDRFQEEVSHLIPLPAQAFDTAEVVYRCVTTEGRITYAQNRYSVPWRYIGLTLPVRITETEIIIYGPQIEEVARHRLFAKHETGRISELKSHLPRDDSERKYEILKTRFDELGEAASRFFAELVRRRRYGKDEGSKILALLETYQCSDLLAALERALRYGAYSRSAIERILAVSARPKTSLDKLADKEQQQLRDLMGGESVRPRTGKEYRDLFDQPPCEEAEDDPTDTPDDEAGGPQESGPDPS
jgi:transposase